MQKAINDPTGGLFSPSLYKKDENDVQPVEISQMLQVISIPFRPIRVILSGMIMVGEMICKGKFFVLKRINRYMGILSD